MLIYFYTFSSNIILFNNINENINIGTHYCHSVILSTGIIIKVYRYNSYNMNLQSRHEATDNSFCIL